MEEIFYRTEAESASRLKSFYDEFDGTIAEISSTFYSRSKDYDQGPNPLDYFPFGPVGFLQVLWMKLLRSYSLLPGADQSLDKISEQGVDVLRDSITDLAVYAIIFLVWMKRNLDK